MRLTYRPVEIETGSPDREGLMVFDGHLLLALLVRLSDIHEDRSGAWTLEYCRGVLHLQETFATLEQALEWIGEGRQGFD